MTQAARPWLAPLVPLYRLGVALRGVGLRSGIEPVRRLAAPVVSIGNLSTGGAGKTPLVIALARALVARGLHVDVLSRGYGRRSALPRQVNLGGTADDFGDEPLVIAAEANVPVYVTAKRYDAGMLAEDDFAKAQNSARNESGHDLSRAEGAIEKEGTLQLAEKLDKRRDVSGHEFTRADKAIELGGALAPEGGFSGILPRLTSFSAACLAPAGTVHLLDDGFQHRQLQRDVDILLVNAVDLDDHLLPAGNLREPLQAMRRATVAALTMPEAPVLEATLRSRGLWNGPVWRLHRRMHVPMIDGPVVAFCGIARSDQFFAGLEDAGLHVASRIAFADHHRYVQHDIDCILDAARTTRAAALITTEKDRVRLAPFVASISEALPLQTAGLRIEIENETSAIDWLLGRLAKPALTP